MGSRRCSLLGKGTPTVYSDTVSASRFGTRDREDWPRLVDDVNAGRLGFVWLWDASRGDRTPGSWFEFLAACRDHRVEVHSERDDHTYRPWLPRDWKTLAESGVDAAYESEIKSADIRRGIGGAAMKGKPHGVPPYGFSRVYDPSNRKIFTHRPNEHAPIVCEIIERVAKRDPIHAITRDLNERGVPSPQWSGVPHVLSPWGRQTIRKIATNPAYAGLRSHKDELHPANWEGIVSRRMLEDARAVLGEPDRKSSAPGALTYLLSYVMVGPCGDINTQPEREGRAARYRCLQDGCTSIGVTEADEHVTDVVLERLSQPDARALFTQDDDGLTAARDEVAAIEAEARELEAEARAGRVRPAMVAIMDEGIQERLKQAHGRVQAASGNAAALALLGTDRFNVEIGRSRWASLSVAARRAVITALIERIELQPTDVRLSRWTTYEKRLAQAAERIAITPRRD